MDAGNEGRRARCRRRTCVIGPARQTIAVGETYEFEYEAPQGRKTAWLEVRTTSGKWQVQGEVIVR